jgi:hypothetical protein
MVVHSSDSCAPCFYLQLEIVYGEIFRVLKPGATFVSYEWVSTPKYDPKNPEHIRIMDEINFGNGLPVRASIALLWPLSPPCCDAVGAALHLCACL